MSALKSARDQLNQPGEVNLMLVMSGSGRNKLLRLVNTSGSPFYGSQVQRMPQFFMEALGQVLSPLAGLSERLEPAMLQAALQRQRDNESQMESDHLGLKPIEQAVLWRVLAQGPRFHTYDAEALKFYREKTGHPVTVAQAQKALEALRQHMPALVWKAARGEYAVEDAAMNLWFEARQQANQWPPQPEVATVAASLVFRG